MKKFIATVSTTIKAFKLLSNPLVIEKLYKELSDNQQNAQLPPLKFGAKDVFFHKHFMVQVLN